MTKDLVPKEKEFVKILPEDEYLAKMRDMWN